MLRRFSPRSRHGWLVKTRAKKNLSHEDKERPRPRGGRRSRRSLLHATGHCQYILTIIPLPEHLLPDAQGACRPIVLQASGRTRELVYRLSVDCGFARPQFSHRGITDFHGATSFLSNFPARALLRFPFSERGRSRLFAELETERGRQFLHRLAKVPVQRHPMPSVPPSM